MEETDSSELTTRKIQLTQGLYAIVDAEDYEYLSKFGWHAARVSKSKVPYAVRTDSVDGVHVSIRMHRVVVGAEKGQVVDHINHNTLDNRKSNLRVCSKRENSLNVRTTEGSSIYKGVSWHVTRGYWVAGIKVNGKNIYLGRFDNESEAAMAYNRKALEVFGDFAYLNEIGGTDG